MKKLSAVPIEISMAVPRSWDNWLILFHSDMFSNSAAVHSSLTFSGYRYK
jgi:hypothetical protein